MKTFPMGGVHPSENKLSCAKPIEVLPLPDVVTIPLAQHIGAPAVAKVAKGDRVLTGQLIAEAGSFMSANIHSPISGTVTAVDMVVNGQGLRQMMITIKREGDDWAEGIDRSEALVKVCSFSAQEIIAKIKDAGIVGMGGATFPTHVKLSVPPGKKAECVIINGVECEPYLTSDHRTMLEHGEELVVGVTILMKAVGVGKAYIGIENNKPDAIAHLTKIAAGYKGIEVVPLKVMYPQGGEKQLIAAVMGRQVPPPPALPIDVGAVVCNASTTVAVYQAVLKNKPLIERVVTVTGKSVKEPKNLEDQAIMEGDKELKAWDAIARYMKSFDDTDGNGISNVPEYYETTHGRKVVDESRNVIDLVKNPNKFSVMIVGIVLVLILIIILLVVLIRKLIKKRRRKKK